MRPSVRSRVVVPAALAAASLGLVILLAAWAPWRARSYLGPEQAIGGGTARPFVTFASDGAPTAVGVRLSAGALDGLPAAHNTHSRCFDVDGNGSHDAHECIGDEERVLELPAGLWRDTGLPFKWITLNWNADGHLNSPYAHPHFDFHFFAVERQRIEAIRAGSCAELVDCEDFKRASRPVPPLYLPEGHIDVGAVVPRMGNHLLDSRSPELKDHAHFTRTFIYGAYDGELIFWEPMITLDVLRAATDECFEIRQPRAFRQAGYYPTQWCLRHEAESDARTVTLERFVRAEAR